MPAQTMLDQYPAEITRLTLLGVLLSIGVTVGMGISGPRWTRGGG